MKLVLKMIPRGNQGEEKETISRLVDAGEKQEKEESDIVLESGLFY